jgi:predicted ATPase
MLVPNRLKSVLAILQGDACTTRRAAEAVLEVSREHGIALYLAMGTISLCWARAELSDRETGLTEFREALAAFIGQGNRLFVPFYQGLLAEIETDCQSALSRINDALALVGETGEHWSDAFLHRIRGEILLKHNPADTALAEEAFLTAITIAQQQKAKSFELCAAFALAKLYQTAGRSVEAHDVLVSALLGFSPAPEFPAIEEAQTFLVDRI